MKLVFTPFVGELPQHDPASLPPNTATRAFNVRLERGSLQPLNKPLIWKPSTKPGTQKTIYRFDPRAGEPDSGYLFSWDKVVHVVPGPVAGNSQQLTYWTGDGYPRFTDASIATKKGPLPSNSYRLGVPAPELAPQVTLANKPHDTKRVWSPEVWYSTPPIWWPKLEPVFWPTTAQPGYFQYMNASNWSKNKPGDWPDSEPTWWPKEYPPVKPGWWPKANDGYPSVAPKNWPNQSTPPEWWPKAWRWIWPNKDNAPAPHNPFIEKDQEFVKHNWPHPKFKPSWWPPAWQLMYIRDSAGARDEVDRDYVLTFTQQLGALVMEGPPSSPSRMITVTPAVAVELTNLATVPSGDYPWSGRRLYRRIFSGGMVQYALVAELGLDDASFLDDLSDAELPGDTLVSQNYMPPPDSMHSLNVLTNGLMFGASDNDCCVSEPYLPHAWNPFARYPFPHKVVGVGIADNNIVVVTLKNPYLLTGVSPTAMSSIELHLEQGCVSARSIVSGAFGCAYASPDGLVVISTKGSGLVTEGVFTRQQWQALNPSSMLCVVHEQDIMTTFTKNDGSSGSFIFRPDLKQGGIRFTSQTFTAAYRDGLLDSLLIYDPGTPGQFQLWDQGDPMAYIWRSKLMLAPVPVNMTAVRIEADSYDNTTVRLIVGDAVKAETRITDRSIFRLPSGYSDYRVQVEVEGTDTLRKIVIAESPSEIE